MADELHDRGYLVVDGVDGRAHYLKLPASTDLTELPINGIVEARPSGQEKPVDRNIATVAKEGVYQKANHVAQLKQAKDRDPRSAVDAHVRRLEALRRAGIVERLADGVWKVPPDLLQKARTHDVKKDTGLAIELRSHLSIDQQVRAIGATWLDRQLVGNGSIGCDLECWPRARYRQLRGVDAFRSAQCYINHLCDFFARGIMKRFRRIAPRGTLSSVLAITSSTRASSVSSARTSEARPSGHQDDALQTVLATRSPSVV